MDRRFLRYYNDELTFIREMAGEFAAAYPKVAGRLGLESTGKEQCPDPFVERLLEGFAFLAARVQLKFDAEFPRAAQAIMDTVCPGFLAPLPAMGVVELRPDYSDGALAEGFKVARGTELRAHKARDENTACRFTLAHDLTLWPLEITEARYYSKDAGLLNLPSSAQSEAAIAMTLRCPLDLPLSELPVDHLDFYIRGSDALPDRLLEQLFAQLKVVGSRLHQDHRSYASIPGVTIERLGYRSEESLLPTQQRAFEGYRLLREYFAFPERFHFFRICGVRQLFAHLDGAAGEVILSLHKAEAMLENRVDPHTFVFNCSPVINLFRRRADRVQVRDAFSEYPVIIDKTHTLDYEVYSVEEVTGFGEQSDIRLEFQPFYMARDTGQQARAYFTTRRAPRVLNARERAFGRTSSYTGSEVYLSLVDTQATPFPREIKELSVITRATNRHLPIRLSKGGSRGDFAPPEGPIDGAYLLAGPTAPIASHAEGEFTWRLISHLSLNYLSLTDTSPEEGASALRGLLKLYAPEDRAELRQQLKGVLSLACTPITRRLPVPGPITFGRGLELTLRLDEQVFEGRGIFVLGSVLERFFQKYVAINSFTETVIRSEQRGEVTRWPLQTGTKHPL